MLQKTTKALFISMWLTLWRKTVFVNMYPLLMVWSKQFFKQIQIFLRICPFSNMVRKTNFLSISVTFFESVTFVSKKKSSLWISPKKLQKKKKALFWSMFLTLWRKTVFVNIYPILLIWSKIVVYTNPYFPQDFSLSNMVRK